MNIKIKIYMIDKYKLKKGLFLTVFMSYGRKRSKTYLFIKHYIIKLFIIYLYYYIIWLKYL